MTAKLNVNIDHVATVRQARRTIEPSVVAAAAVCEQAGADGITVHIRGDRRHIQDDDITLLRRTVSTYLNVEMAATGEMKRLAIDAKPDAVSLVPENPNEITTEGGLDVLGNLEIVRDAVKTLRDNGIFASIFIDPNERQIEAAQLVGAQQIEICTAEYAESTLQARAAHGEGLEKAVSEIERIRRAVTFAKNLGLKVAAGHGLTVRNVGALAAVPDIEEFNIGHSIISRAIFIGLDAAVKEMIQVIRQNSLG
jgi:pyridoxine 5-phosphate synthase